MSTSANHDDSPQTPATTSAAWEIHLRIPELPAAEQASSESACPPGATVKPTTGMLVLNRIIDKRDARRNWRRTWGKRLWLTATCLSALSALALFAAFLRVDSGDFAAESEIADNTEVIGELADNAVAGAVPDALGAQQAGLRVAEPASSSTDGGVSTADYEKSSGPAIRGAWLTGTIEFDEKPKR